MRITKINSAEAIIEPFWDPRISGLDNWKKIDGKDHGLYIRQNWCWVDFGWAKKPGRGTSLKMWRECDVDCSEYDSLIVSAKIPEQSIMRVVVNAEKRRIVYKKETLPYPKKEYFIDLNNAKKIRKITIEIYALRGGISTGWFNWIGLQNKKQLPAYLSQWNQYDERWEGYLKPEAYAPKFKPVYGFLFDKKELLDLRKRYYDLVKKRQKSPIHELKDESRQFTPEQSISDFVLKYGTDTRYSRDRDAKKIIQEIGPQCAFAGLILKDKKLLRLSARYALSMGMCVHWDDGMISRFPGGIFHHWAFVNTLCMYEIALILDMAGDMFTDTGRDFLLRRIGEEGIGINNFRIWNHEWVFHNNALIWFSLGRMLGYLALEKYMRRVKPYADLAFKDALETAGYNVLPDGGHNEGPGYAAGTWGNIGLVLYYYARSRKLNFKKIFKPLVKNTSHYIEAFISTDKENDIIPIGDAYPHLVGIEDVAVMAYALPGTQWAGLFRKITNRLKVLPVNPALWKFERFIPENAGQTYNPFICLKETGIVSSIRYLKDKPVKILIAGNRKGMGHSHEDKGSFVIEFGHETFAMDIGICKYDSPVAGILKNCEQHNMLVPFGTDERPAPPNPLPCDVKPEGIGDRTKINVRMDLTHGWKKYYRKWTRKWISEKPGSLVIEDEYELKCGKGVKFYWITKKEVRVAGREIMLIGRDGNMRITPPEDTAVRVDKFVLNKNDFYYRIAIVRTGKSGKLVVNVELLVK